MFDLFASFHGFSFSSWLKRTFKAKRQSNNVKCFGRGHAQRVRPSVEVLEARVNLSPVISLTTTTITDVAQSAVNLDSALTVTDTTSSIIEGASVKIAVNYQSNEDSLNYTGLLPSGVTASFDSVAGKLTFVGPASVEAYQGLLQTVTFTDKIATPNFSLRSIAFTVVDDQYDTDTEGLSVNVMANQTITFGSLHPATYGVSPITLSATASSNLHVSYSVVSGPGSVNGNTLTVTGAGTIVVEADQAGNVDYLAAPAVQQDLVVNKATLSVTDITASDKVYDGTKSASLNTSSGGLAGVIGLDDVSLISTGAVGTFASADAANGILVTVWGLTLGGAQAGDYQLPTPEFTTIANITPAMLTVFGITAKDKPYDGGTAATLRTTGEGVTGVLGADDVSLVSSGVVGTFASADAANGITVSVSGLTLGGAQAGDYQLPIPQEMTHANILPATLTVTGITASNKVYDGSTVATLDTTGAQLVGVIGMDSVNLLSTNAVGTFASPNAARGITVNVSGLTLNGAQAGDYQLPIPQATTTANITPANLTVSGFTANNKVYDGNTSASLTTTGAILTGVIGLDDVSLVSSGAVGAFASKDVANGITVTVAGLTLSGAQAGDYQLPTPQQTTMANITPATLTASIIGMPSKTYDGSTSAALTPANFALSGLVGSETFTVTQSSGTYNSQDVTSANTVTASLAGSDFTAGLGTLASDYTLPTSASGAADITPATLTVNGITARDKAYDGGTTASLDTSGGGIIGAIGLDDVSLDSSGAVGAFASKDVANGITVTVAGLTLSGAQAGDYQLPTPQETTTANITPAILTASIIGTPSKIYDGTTAATLTPANFALSGLVGNESFTVTRTSGTYNSQDVATANSVTAGLTGGDFTPGIGTLASDYSLPTSASGAADITPATLTVDGITASDKVYDGSTAATLDTTAAGIIGVIGLDDVSLVSTAAVGTFASQDAANSIPVTVSGLTLGGAQADDYQLPTPQETTTAKITPATLTVSGITASNKVYDGGAAATLNTTAAGITGVIGLDDVSLVSTSAVGTFASKDVANGITVTIFGLNLRGAQAGDYQLPAPQETTTADITPATLTVSGITAGNKVYDGGATATLNTSGAGLSGIIGLDDVSLVTTGAVGTFASPDVANGITVTVSGLILGGAQAGDYQLPTPQETTTANITPATLTVSGITASNKVYDGGAGATLNISGAAIIGVIGMDDVALVTSGAVGTFASRDVANGITVTLSGLTLRGAQAGDYQLPTPQQTTTADITPATLTVNGIIANDKVYDGGVTATLNTIGAGLTGVIGQDDVSLVTSGAVGAFASQDVASGITVTVSGLTLGGAQAGDYRLPTPQQTTTADITPATLTVTGITAIGKVYDGSRAASLNTAGGGIIGVIGLDNVSLDCSGAVGAFASPDVANGISVTISGLTLSGAQASDYQLPTPQQTTTANITPATLTVSGITANNKTYDGGTTAALSTTGGVLSGVIGLDDVSLDCSGAVGTFASKDVANGINVTVSGLALSGTQAGDYQLRSPQQLTTANITPALLTASIIGNPSKTYDRNASAALIPANFTLSGLIGMESFTVTQASGTYNSPDVASATTVTASLAGSDFIAGFGTLASDYTLPTGASGPADITPATLTVTGITASDKVYDGGTSAALITTGSGLSGVIGLDDVSLNSRGAVGTFTSKDVANGITVTVSGLTLNGAQAGDYQLSTPQETTSANITPATLTVTGIAASNKVYDGGATATLNTARAGLTGVIGLDDVSLVASGAVGTFGSIDVANGIPVTLAGLTLNGAQAGDYQLPIPQATTTANITPATLTVSGITAINKVYDGTGAASLNTTGAGISGVIGLDDVTLDTSGAVGEFASHDVANGITVTVSGLTLHGAQAGDYQLPTPQETTTANINRATLTVSGITANNKTYDGGTTAILNTTGAAISGVIGLDDVTLVSSSAIGTFASKDVANDITVTVSGLTLTGAEAGDYQLPTPQQTTTANITPATLSVTGITASNKVYDGSTTATLSTIGAAISGVVGVDDVTLVSSGALGAFASKDVARGITVTVSGLTLGGAQAGDYQLPTPQESTTANITPATLTVTGITASNKVYDRSTADALNTAGAGIWGVIGLDDVSLVASGAVGTFASQDVANGIPVNVTGLTLSGAQAGDYLLPVPQETTTANITPAILTVTGITASNKVYDGGATASLNTNGDGLSGVIGPDDVTLVSSGAVGAFASKDVASGITVSVSGLTLRGAQAGDYQLPTPQETTTANITPATLTVSGIMAKNKVYDRSVLATLNTAADGVTGVIGLDDVTLISAGAVGSFASKDVANGITVTVSGLTLGGAQAGDYQLPSPQQTAMANITPATLTVSGITANNKVYDGTTTGTADFTSALLGGVIAADDVSLNTSAYTASFASANAANGIAVTIAGLHLKGAQASDYTLSQPAGLTANISKASQTITFAPLAPVDYGTGSVTLDATADSGLGVTFSVVSGPGSVSGATLAITGPGSILVQADQAGNGNYLAAPAVYQVQLVNRADDSITFNPLNPVTFGVGTVPLTASSSNSSDVNDPVIFTVLAGPGFTSGDTLHVTGGGSILIEASQAADTNYNAASPVFQTLTVNPDSQTITFNGPTTPATYGVGPITLSASADSGLPVAFAVVSGPGFISGNTLIVVGAGSVVIEADQDGDTDYRAAPAMQRTLVVNPAPLTVTATNESSTYGQSDPTLAFTYTGLVNGDLAANFSGNLVRAAGASVGAYSITQNTLVATGNYTIAAFNPATFTVNPASLTVSASNESKIFGQSDPTLGFTYTGLVNGDVAANFTGNLARAAGANVGAYAINQDTLAATGNYAIGSFNAGTFTINPASDTIIFGPLSPVTFGVGTVTLNATGGGSSSPVVFTVLSGSGSVSGTTLTVSGAGAIVVQAMQAGDTNYRAANPVIQTLTVNPASQSIAFTGPTSPATFGVGPITLVATADSGLPVAFSVVSGPGFVIGNKLTVTGAGAIVVQANQPGNSDYVAAAPVQATLVVNKADDSINFGTLRSVTFGVRPVTLSASGLSTSSIVFTVISGPGAIIGNTLTVNGAGTIVVEASQAGDNNYLAAPPVDQTLTVNQADDAISFGSLTPVTFGAAPQTLSATGGGSSNPVVFTVLAGPGSVNGSTLTINGGGSILVEASQAGDANFHDATPVLQRLTVNAASQTITFAGLGSPVTFGVAPITLSASASSGLPVAFSVVSGPGSISGNVLTVTGAGAIVIEADQGGNADFTAAPPVRQTLLVNKASQAISFAPLGPVNFSAIPDLFAATTTSGLPVAYTVLSGPGTITGDALTLSGIGSLVIQASQAGDANYNAATAVQQTLVVTKGNQTITFTPLIPTTFSVNPIALTATASSGLPIAYVVVSGPGKISGSSLTLTGVGSIVIQASQPGNANYNPATTVKQTLVVSKASQAISFGALSPVTYGTSPIALTATSNSGLPIAYTVVSGPGAIKGNKLIVRGAGSIVVQAAQAGDANHLAAAPIRQTLTVNRIVLTLTGISAVNKAYTGTSNAAVKFTHYVLNGLLPGDRGLVLLNIRGYAAQFASANVGNGIAVSVAGLALQGTRAGNYTLVQPTSLTANITPANQTIKFDQAAAAVYSSGAFSIPVALHAAASSGLPVTFTVLSSTTIGAITITSTQITGAADDNGATTALLTIDGTVTGATPTASILIEASQAGDANHNAAAPVKMTLAVATARHG